MKLKSTKRGEWPPGLHWTDGEVRTVSVPEGAEVPGWLVQVKGKSKKATPKADEG